MAASAGDMNYQRHAWVLLLVPALILGALSIRGLAGGYASEAPNNLLLGAVTASTPMATVNLLNYIARGAAGGTLTIVVLVILIAATGYRKGAPWAWYVEFYIFIASLAALAMEATEGQDIWVGVLVFGIPLFLGLFLPYRRFFPKKSS